MTLTANTNPARKMSGLTVLVATLGLCLSSATYSAAVVYSDSGATPADLSAAADALTIFRSDLGANNGAGPSLGGTTGRREINWDAPALDAVADPNFMPADQFNRAVAPFARGAQFSTAGNGFFVSRRCEQDGDAAGCGGSNILFGFGPGSGTNLSAFSAQRIFSPVSSNVMDVTFAVPGSPGQVATTSAFGAIFTDVEVADLTRMELFGLDDQSLGSFFVPTAVDGGLSFLGVRFDGGELIARVRLTLGDMALTGHGAFAQVNSDFVALDDFIYAEPLRVVSEPGSVALVLVAAAALSSRRRKPQAAVSGRRVA